MPGTGGSGRITASKQPHVDLAGAAVAALNRLAGRVSVCGMRKRLGPSLLGMEGALRPGSGPSLLLPSLFSPDLSRSLSTATQLRRPLARMAQTLIILDGILPCARGLLFIPLYCWLQWLRSSVCMYQCFGRLVAMRSLSAGARPNYY